MDALTVTLTIDQQTVTTTAGKTILEAALDHGIYIPHLCSHENLHPTGACRMCVVRQQGVPGVVTSCSTKVQPGMVIDTKDELAEKIRKLSCDFMFKTHPPECTNCPKYGKCQLQSISQYVGDTGRKLKANPILVPTNASNPIILHEMYRCILCGRCVRACQDMRGVGAIRFKKVKGRMMVVVNGDSLNEAGCRFCSACVDVCPTGSIREHEAIALKVLGKTREEAVVPCRAGCPAGIDVPRYIRYVKQGDCSAATAVIREKVPFPEALGYICTHPCELECKRNYLNEPISIRNIKRYAAQHDDGAWRSKGFKRPLTGKKVAVIGAGPAGLTAAYYLAKLGHKVTVFEALPKTGGMMRYGIPVHRLPRDVIEREAADIQAAGVEIRTNERVDNAPALLGAGYDAVFVAVGTHKGVRLPLKGADLQGVLINTDLLRAVETGENMPVGERVVVLGGGNVALDCASVAKRLGAKEVRMACLEQYAAMTCTEEERTWAEEEGIEIHNGRNFLGIRGENGKVTGVDVVGITAFSFDAQGVCVDERIPDSEQTLPADTVIFAIGQRPDIGEAFGLQLTRGRIATEGCKTSVPGIFAAGDAVTGTASVIRAIAGARLAAQEIDRYLGGDGAIDEILAPLEHPSPILGNLPGFGVQPRVQPDVVCACERCACFDTMDNGLEEEGARFEASRCLQCDLRLDLAPQKFWSDYAGSSGGQT